MNAHLYSFYKHHVFFSSLSARRALHSFPTRRSSDLLPVRLDAGGDPSDGVSPEERVAVEADELRPSPLQPRRDRKSTRLNSSHVSISYAVFCLKKKTESAVTICSS